MRIGIDARMLAHSGIGTYVRHLLGEYAAEPGPDEFVVFTSPELAASLPECARFEVRPVHVPVYGFAEHTLWPRLLQQARCDLYHVPHYNVPIGFTLPLVVTIHDLIHLLFPDAMRRAWHPFVARRLLANALRRAGRVIAVSDCTRRDLVRVMRTGNTPIRVIPEGVGAEFRPLAPAAVEAFRRQQALPAQFVLHVGLRRPHKNVLRLVQAYAAVRPRLAPPPHLVLWGRADVGDATLQAAVLGAGLGDVVHCIDRRLPDAEMPLLYNAAQAVVIPSLYEGFGLPALEAMACGVPTLAADAGALPEIVGDAALRVDPLDLAALTAALARLLADTDLRAALARRGPERARRFSWRETAARTRAVYAEIAPPARAALRT